jgi:DNA mismatch repair protein MutS
MSLATDKQTLDDLNIFENKGNDPVFQLFNYTSTGKGAEILKQMFRQPMSSQVLINERIGIIRFFGSFQAAFPFQASLFELVEEYLENTDARTIYAEHDHGLLRRLQDLLGGQDHDYKVLYKGVSSFVDILHVLREFTGEIGEKPGLIHYRPELDMIRELLGDPDFAPFLNGKKNARLPFKKIVAFDKQIRFVKREKIKKILHHIYQMDVYIAVAKAAAKHNLNFPAALSKELHEINLKGFYHPLLGKAVPYSLRINPDSNIIFLTGANMAGKSTFMKALGISMYLAHMGFPVAAESMEFSVMDGLYSTINLPDNLSLGYSHFYTEVLRIKKMARELSTGKNLFIIFDELFRGTNVRDAYDATIALTGAFSEKRNCKFVISTHIVEAGEILREKYSNINFLYLPTRMKGSKPVYTYQLEQGITEDRHDMLIINNEGILELLEKKKGTLKMMNDEFHSG